MVGHAAGTAAPQRGFPSHTAECDSPGAAFWGARLGWSGFEVQGALHPVGPLGPGGLRREVLGLADVLAVPAVDEGQMGSRGADLLEPDLDALVEVGVPVRRFG